MPEVSPVSISFDTSKAVTARPVIADKTRVRVRCANVGEVSFEGKGNAIKFEFHLLDPAPTTEGGQVKPGFPLFDTITLFDKNTPPGQIPDWCLPKISTRVDALLGTGDPDDVGREIGQPNKKGKPVRPNFGPDLVPDLIGKECFAVLKVKTGEYVGNDIVELIHPSDVK